MARFTTNALFSTQRQSRHDLLSRLLVLRLLAACALTLALLPMFSRSQTSAKESASRSVVRLSLDAVRAVTTGQFQSSDEPEQVKFSQPAVGRYFCFESLSAQDGRPYAAIADLDLQDPSGNSMDRTEWKIAYVDSEELDREDGSAENAIDDKYSTFWHTQWVSASPNHPHHLVIDLGGTKTIGGFRYLPRPGDSGTGGRIRDYRIYVGDDLVRTFSRTEVLPSHSYLFSYFTGDTEGLHLAWSLSGYRWDAIDHGRVFLKPADGTMMRDPCLFRDRDGGYHLVWTAGWTGNFIGYAFSADLIHWSSPRSINVMADQANVVNCWAPEIFRDDSRDEYILFWSSTVTNSTSVPEAPRSRIYFATTKDFKTFSPTRLLYDPGFSVVDATLVYANGSYRLVFQDDRSHQLYFAKAAAPTGPFEKAVSILSPTHAEGPAVFHVMNQDFVVFHAPMADRFGGVKTTDWEHWEDISSGLSFPPNTHQGTALDFPPEATQALQQAGRLEIGTSVEAMELGIGDWIWTTNIADKQTCRLWREFEIPEHVPLSRAELRVTADNGYTVYLDGREIGRGSDPFCITEYDLTWIVSPGRHVLAIEAINETMDAGVIAGVRVKLADGKNVEVLSDESWWVVPENNIGWRKERRPKASWFPAQVVGYGGRAWWQRPHKIIQSPPPAPPVIHFWQQTWVMVTLLVLCISIALVCVSFGLRLTFQAREDRLLKRERSRIARDIHDDVGAGLTQLTLLGELVLRETANEKESLNRLNELCTRARALLGSLDEIVWAVNPRRDTVQDFASFLSGHAQEFLSTTAIRCRLEVPEELPAAPLDLPKRRNLLFAVKEAIRNAARHSHASELTLTISAEDERLRVVVEDNGRGFVPKVLSPRNGLTNMHQRLAEVGGVCTITSSPNLGCRVVFDLPLNRSKWNFSQRNARSNPESNP